jgi:hypothetical protein
MAKGLKPVIHNFFGDPCAIFDRKYVFDTSKQAVEMILSEEYSPAEYRKHIEVRYNLNDVFNKYESILCANRKKNNLSPFEKKEPRITKVMPTNNRAHYLNDTQRNGFNQKSNEQTPYPIFSIGILKNLTQALQILGIERLKKLLEILLFGWIAMMF